MEVMCFKWHPSLFFPDPISLYLSISSSPSLTLCASPCPSVMALVHPHVYLCYKAEESGRLKMKTPTREHLCVHFVNAQMRSAMCARVCPRRCVEVHVCDRVWICTLLSFLDRSIFFIFKGGIPLHFATHCIPAFSALSIPLISGPNFRHGQVPHFFVSAWQDRWKWHSNLKQ